MQIYLVFQFDKTLSIFNSLLYSFVHSARHVTYFTKFQKVLPRPSQAHAAIDLTWLQHVINSRSLFWHHGWCEVGRSSRRSTLEKPSCLAKIFTVRQHFERPKERAAVTYRFLLFYLLLLPVSANIFGRFASFIILLKLLSFELMLYCRISTSLFLILSLILTTLQTTQQLFNLFNCRLLSL